MKVLWGLGKVLTLMFWAVALVNQLTPMIHPFDLLISLVAELLLLTHMLEVLLFNGRLSGRPHPWRDRLLILVLGIFHAHILPVSPERDTSHA